MISVGLSAAAMESYLDKIALGDDNCGIAVVCINSLQNVTVSGDENQIVALKELLDQDQHFSRQLHVNVAYYSQHTEDIADEYLSSIQGLEPGEMLLQRPLIASSVTGQLISGDELRQSEYWVKNMVSPVKFSQTLTQILKGSKKKLAKASHNPALIYDVLGIGPHSALQRSIKEIIAALSKEKEIKYACFLTRDVAATETLLNTFGRLHCQGYTVNFANINLEERDTGSAKQCLTDLPAYPFDGNLKYWHELRLSKNLRFREQPRLDLLGTKSTDWNPLEARWRKFIRTSETPWVEDHKINGCIIYPASGMLVMAIEVMRQIAQEDRPIKGYLLNNTTFSEPLGINAESNGLEVQLSMRPIRNVFDKTSSSCEFELYVHENDIWTGACRRTIQAEYDEEQTKVDGGKENNERLTYYRQLYRRGVEVCNHHVESNVMYEYLDRIGLGYGSNFQALRQIACNDDGEALAEVRTFQWSAQQTGNHEQQHLIHPTTLDVVAQLLFLALSRGGKDIISTTIPTRIPKAWISSSGLSYPSASSIDAYTKSIFTGHRGTRSSLFALDKASGALLITIELETTTVSASNINDILEHPHRRQYCYSVDWKPDIDELDREQLLLYCESFRFWSLPDKHKNIHIALTGLTARTIAGLANSELDDSRPWLQNYLSWVRDQARRYESGDLHSRNADLVALLNNEEDLKTLCRDIENTGAETGKFFVRIGRMLPQILRNRGDSLMNVLAEGELASGYYRAASMGRTCFGPIAEYLSLLSHKNPMLKVLDISSQARGSTAEILDAFNIRRDMANTPRCARYDLTFLHSDLLESTKDIFRNYKHHLNFAALDLDKNPRQQGFGAGSYDLIIASGVSSISLRNIQ